MRILIANTRHYYGGGDSTYAFNLAALLRERGHVVNFFAMQGAANLPDPNTDLFVSHVDFRAMNKHKNPAAAWRVLARSIYSTEARRKFTHMLDRVRPDIVHLQNIHAHITPSIILAAKKRGIPVVWTLHDYKLVCPNSHCIVDQTGQICEACRGGRFWQAVQKRCKKGSLLASGMASMEAYAHRWMRVRENVSAFLCPSSFLRNKLLENGFDPRKTIHLPLPLPEKALERTSDDRGYMLFLGKLETIKGILPLFEAARLAPNVPVIAAGRVEEPLKSQMASLLPPNVSYAGFQSGSELAELQRGARALVFPSLWYENQPMSILETFALGKPVIASNLGGMRELIGANERGLLVPMGDAAALAQAMTWMSDHPQEAHGQGEKAFQYAVENHSAENHYQRMMVIYQEAIRAS